jgi:Ca2+-binding EF-hand superfamily protein
LLELICLEAHPRTDQLIEKDNSQKELRAMWNTPTEEELAKIPRLYETENISLKDKIIHLHFFIGGCDWYIAEYSPEEDLFWGYAILNGDTENAEWGYISFRELRELVVPPGIEVHKDLHWEPIPVFEIPKIKLHSD